MLGWLLGMFLPACAASGAEGVPVPPPLDLARLERPSTPNTALAAPDGTGPRPDIVTSVYPLAAPALFAAVRRVASSQPRTYALSADPVRLEASFVERSAVWNFPDIITVQVSPRGEEASTLALYSRSLYGHSDFGVNRARLEIWLAALQSEN